MEIKSLLKNSLLIAALTTAFTASAFEYNGVIYDPIDDTTCKVGKNGTGFSCVDFTFPETVYDGETAYTLVEIGDDAFNGSGFLRGSVFIPATVTKIGSFAFKYTGSNAAPLKVTIAGEDVVIGDNAFENAKMDELNITGSVKKIGTQVFYATNLTKAVFPEGLEQIDGIGTFGACMQLTEVEFPSTLTLVGYYTFMGCNNITKVTCKAMTPPATLYNMGIFNSGTTATLYVPAGTKDAYAAATGWKAFPTIEEIAESGVAANRVNGAKVTARGGVINVEGAEGDVEVYNAVGQLLYKGAADAISVAGKGVHIVKVNGKAVKVAL